MTIAAAIDLMAGLFDLDPGYLAEVLSNGPRNSSEDNLVAVFQSLRGATT